MGKSSKRKSKKLAKQARAMHQKNVEVYEETMSTLDETFFSLGDERKRERIRILEKQLELSLNVEKAFASINRHQSYKTELSGVCSELLFNHIQSSNYIQASHVYNDMIKYPLEKGLINCIKPFSNLMLLWAGEENVKEKDTIENNIERMKTIDKIIQNAIGIIRGAKARSPFHILFLTKSLTELCRQQLFEVVEFLSLAMLRNVGKPDSKKEWMQLARTSLVYSYIDKLRFSQQFRCQRVLGEVRKITLRPLHRQLPSGTGYLAYSLLDFYACVKEKDSSKSIKKVPVVCIDSLKKYIASRSRDSNNICYTCHEEDTQEYESLVCQGCRVVSYCCRDHQRLNYLHHEETGTRGLGHKQLCPVFKAYRRKRDNIDTSKEGHLDRKFERACKRFLQGTFEDRSQKDYIYPIDMI